MQSRLLLAAYQRWVARIRQTGPGGGRRRPERVRKKTRVNPRQIFGNTFAIEVAIAAVVFALILLAVVVALALSRRRKRAGRPASSRDENMPLELSYAAVIACVVGFIVFLSFRASAKEHSSPRPAVATASAKDR